MKAVLSRCIFLVLLCTPALAADGGIMLSPAPIYISPDSGSARLDTVERGRELVLLETSGEWAHVMAAVTVERNVTGWVPDRYVIRKTTPQGDRILFGEAVNSETEASRRRGRKGAAEDAMRLYARTAEYFPNSPLAPEAAYRAADVRWQLEKADALSRPSAKEMDPNMRHGIEERYMRDVMKKYPGSKWSDLAAFHLIDNKVCGDWRGLSKCPERESDLYEKYATERPQSPVAPEALYEAARRQAALIEIYKSENKPGNFPKARSRAIKLANKIVARYPQSDWASRAQTLIYMVEQNIPTYGGTAQ